MKNITTKNFCKTFGACPSGMRFALRYATMRECYSALLAGEAGDNSAGWAIWAATREGVMSDRDLRLFAVRCARRVRHIMKDNRSVAALDVAERYANGEATEEELEDARAAAWAARDAADAAARAAAWAARDAAKAAAWDAAWAAADVAADVAYDVAYDAECKAQLKILREFGNPFEVGEE